MKRPSKEDQTTEPLILDEQEQEELVHNFRQQNESSNRLFQKAFTLLYVIAGLLYLLLGVYDFSQSSSALPEATTREDPTVPVAISCIICSLSLFALVAALRLRYKKRWVGLSFALSTLNIVYWLVLHSDFSSAWGDLWFLLFIPIVFALFTVYTQFEMERSLQAINGLEQSMYKVKGA